MPRQFSHVYFLTKGKYELGRVLPLSLLAITLSVAAISQASSHLLCDHLFFFIRTLASDHEIRWTKEIECSANAEFSIFISWECPRRWEEAWGIAATDTAIANRDRRRTLPTSYLPLVKKYTWLNCLGMTYGFVYSLSSPPPPFYSYLNIFIVLSH